MSREDVQGFVGRPWELVETAKLVGRAERFWREGAEGCVRASEALREHARAMGAVVDRAEDLRAHIAWRMLLDRTERHVGRGR
jgi:hypothetical protein